MDDERVAAIGMSAGALVLAAGGAVLGARMNGWSGGLIGVHVGLLVGMALGGGLVGTLTRRWSKQDRAEAHELLGFALGAIPGAALGYWVGGLGIRRLSPAAGLYAGVVVIGMTVGLIVMYCSEGENLVSGVVSAGVAGGGFGAALARAIDPHPALLAAGLLVGTVIGASIGHSVNVAIQQAAYQRYPSR
ncbi:hypothetical protein ACI2LF_19925 [Kribbella sp. NPDC020789]